MLKRMTIVACSMLAGSTGGSAWAVGHNPDTDWFSQAGYGVFLHYLWDVQCVGNRPNAQGKGGSTSWDECVRAFDTERLARQMQEAGAGYVIFTMMQRTRYLIAPNETYERLTGYPRGEATSIRDLVADLYTSLHARGIPLLLYWTGDGPRQDAKAADGLGGWSGKVTDEYVRNWAAVAAEYSKRYGDKVRGWWVDGCYGHIGYNETRWSILATGLRAGNPKAIVALNNPSMSHANSSTDNDDFTTGEVNAFTDIPDSRWRDGKQFHILSYLGKRWGGVGLRYDADYMTDYIGAVNQVGGVVSIDVCLFRDGSVAAEQLAVLKAIRPGLRGLAERPAFPPGNLAYRQPAKQLSLDGSHPLPVNGGGGQLHLPRYGVDGRPETWAQAGGEWPWTYEVDLRQEQPVARVVVTFRKDGFATDFAAELSRDRKAWTTAGRVTDSDGTERTHIFDTMPTPARYLRVRAFRPNGPNQPGGQMGVSELEAYGPAPGAPSGARFIERLKHGEKIRIATMGTSLTAGSWRWVDVMKEWLDAQWPGQVTIVNEGVSASASSGGPAGNTGIDRLPRVLACHPDVVFIEFGTNDAYTPYNISMAQSRQNLETFIDRILTADPRTEIILQTMNCALDVPARNTLGATQRPQLAAYFDGYREVAAARGLLLVDHYLSWLRLMHQDREAFLALVPDGLHPQLPGYRQILLPELKRRLFGPEGRTSETTP